MQTFSAVKKVFFASALALAIAGCNDAGSGRDLSKEELQFLSHLDQARFYQKQGQLKASIEEAQNALKLDPGSKEPYLIVADNLLIAGDARSAEKQFRHLLEPEDGGEKIEAGNLHNRAVLGLATALAMQKKTAEARTTLEQLNNPSNEDEAESLLLQGDMALSENQPEKATEFYNQAREVAPTNVKPIVALARLAAMRNDDAQVKELIQQAEQVNGADPELWLWKAQYAESQQRYPEAEDAYIKALDDIGRYDLMTFRKYQTISRLITVLRAQGKVSEAFVYEEILAKSAPGAIKAGYETARKLYAEGKLDEAAAELEKVLQQAPGHNDSGILLGMIRYSQGDLVAAERLLSKHSTENTTPSVAKVLAATKIKLQQPQEAAEILRGLEGQDKDPEILSLLGIASLASGESEEGLKKIEKALSINPDNIELRDRLARYYLSKSDPDSAMTQLKKILELDKNNDAAKTLMTSAYVSADKVKQAEAYAKDWLKASPGNANALNALGSIALKKDNEAEARKYFAQAAEANPNTATPLLNLANLEARKQDWEAAQRAFEAALKADPENTTAIGGLLTAAQQRKDVAAASTTLKEFASNNPKAVNIRLALAELSAIEGNLENAEKLLQEAAEAGEDDRKIERFRSNVYRIAVEKKLTEKDYSGARNILAGALEKDATNQDLQLLAAKTEFMANQPDKGLELIAKAKATAPQSPAPLEFEGDYHASKGEFEKAVESYRAAWNLQNTQGLAIKMHQALRQSNQVKASLQPLQEWLSIQPNSPQAMTLLAMGYQADGQYQRAIEQYEGIRKVRPNDAVALNNLAWLYQETGNSAAETTAKAAYDISPQNAAIADTYGWILVQNNKAKEGVAVLEKAHELDPNAKEIALHLADGYEKTGQADKAQQIRNKFPE